MKGRQLVSAATLFRPLHEGTGLEGGGSHLCRSLVSFPSLRLCLLSLPSLFFPCIPAVWGALETAPTPWFLMV